MEEVLTTGEAIVDLQIVGETRREPGRDRHYVASYYPVALARGERLGIGITVADVTDRAEAAQALREQRDLYEALMRAQSELGLAFVLLDGDRIVYANAATEALTGRSARELYALPSILATLPLDVHRPVAGRLAGVREGREPAEPFRTEIQRPDGTRVPVETAGRRLGGPTDPRMAVIARDITDRVAQERELQRVLEVEQAARRASEAAHARVRLLADTSALLERSQTSDDALQEVAELLVARIADSCALDVLDLAGHLRRAGADARAPDGRRRMLAMEGDPEVARAMQADQPIFLEDPGEGSVLGRSATLVPLVAHGRDVGVLSLGWRDVGRRPARDEWSLIEALAQRIALAVDGALQYRERAHVAQTLQASLLPAALPDIPGATVAAQYVASGEGMDVGGDFYDVFALDDGSWILVIGDVLGQGRRGRGGHRAGPLHRARRGRPLALAGGDAGRAQRRDAAPAQPRPALRHRRPRAPRAARGRRRPPRRGLRRPPAAGAAARGRRAPRRCRARAPCWASSTTRAASTRRSSWGRATPWCSTPTG